MAHRPANKRPDDVFDGWETNEGDEKSTRELWEERIGRVGLSLTEDPHDHSEFDPWIIPEGRGRSTPESVRFYTRCISGIDVAVSAYAMESGRVREFWTVLSQSSFESRSDIYDIEMNMFELFDNEEFRFHTLVRGDDGQIPEDATNIYEG